MSKIAKIEDIIKEVDSFEPVIMLRLGIAKFLENLSFDEKYLRMVLDYKKNKEQTDFFNLFEGIRNTGKK